MSQIKPLVFGSRGATNDNVRFTFSDPTPASIAFAKAWEKANSNGKSGDAAATDGRRISKHTFEWTVDNTTENRLESKTFLMPVANYLHVWCLVIYHNDNSSPNSGMITYELFWPHSQETPLFYKCFVYLRKGTNYDQILWTDIKADKDGNHVSSSAVAPKGSALINALNGPFKISVGCEFNLGNLTENKFMTVAEFALPLLKESVMSDVVVVCGDKTFNCHKAILAGRSEYFKKLITDLSKEENAGKLELKALDPDVVDLVIKFIYSDDVAEASVTWELFEAAKMYDLHRLKYLCLRSLRKNLNVGNCCKMLEATFRHDLDELFDYTMNFLKRNKTDVAKTEGWKDVTENNKLLAKILLHLM